MQAAGGSFFGRRKGKALRPSQREALRTALPALLLDLSNAPPVDLSGLFPVPVDEVRLEIGFGAGEHFLHEARHLPRAGFLGVEPFENSFAKTVAAIKRDGIQNVRLFNQDAVLLLDWLPPASLARIDLLFPDPWPKTRHWKRRFVNAENLERIARCLKPGGMFRFASDVDAYVKWTQREVTRHGKLTWSDTGIEQCRAPWPGWPGTRYEAKAIVEGRRPAYLTFHKTG